VRRALRGFDFGTDAADSGGRAESSSEPGFSLACVSRSLLGRLGTASRSMAYRHNPSNRCPATRV